MGLNENTNKTEYIVIGNAYVLLEEGVVKGVYLYKLKKVVTLPKDGTSISETAGQGKQVIRQLHFILWNKQTKPEKKTKIYKITVESTTYVIQHMELNYRTYKENTVRHENGIWRRFCRLIL